MGNGIGQRKMIYYYLYMALLVVVLVLWAVIALQGDDSSQDGP